MIYRATGKAIAAAIGVTPGRVSQLRKDGMPDSSVEAAVAWYRRRVDPARAAGQRGPPAPRPPGPAVVERSEVAAGHAAVQRVAELAPLADVALQADRFPLIERELRAALAAVPADLRGQVQLSAGVFRELVGTVLGLVVAAGDESHDPSLQTSDPAECAWLGDFWYAVACGEIVPAPESASRGIGAR